MEGMKPNRRGGFAIISSAMRKATLRRKAPRKSKDSIATIEEYYSRLKGRTTADEVSLDALPHLLRLIAVLRGPGGCPWDHEQHFADYPKLLAEEVEEVREAIDDGDPDTVAEELGDAAWNLLYLLYLAQDEKGIPFDTVLRGVLNKIVRRHEHVFGSVKAGTSEEVLANWRRLKRKEKRKRLKKR